MVTVAPPRTLFPLEQHTWVVVLAVAVGFGMVGALALFVGGEMLHATLCLLLSVVFGYTARTLHRPDRIFRPPLARLLALGAVVVAVTLAALAVRPLATFEGDTIHPVVLAGTAMAVLIQVAVVIVAVESLTRLAPGE